MDWMSATFGAFLGIAAIFGLTAAAIYPLIRRNYLLWGCARAVFFTAMVVAIFPIEMVGNIPAGGPRLALAEAALALGAGATGPFLANYIEPHINLGRARKWLLAMLPLGIFAALSSFLGIRYPVFHQLHDLALLICTGLLAAGLYVAVREKSRAAQFQLLGWGPLVLIGLVAFTYELIAMRDLPYWPYLLLGALVLDFIVTASGIVDGFEVIQKERDRALADIHVAEMMTVTDPLTDIANRRGLEQHFNSEDTPSPDGIALVDCDHFKRINDQFGHDVGDKVLCAVAHGLKGPDIFVARLGGEEFVLLIQGDNWQEKGELARRNMTLAVRSAVADIPYPITASAGLAELQFGESLASVMKRADKALYAAKEAGRNRSVIMTEYRPPSSLKRA